MKNIDSDRQDHESPIAIEKWGWRYHHIGIPTTNPMPGEKYYPSNCECINITCKCKCVGIEWNAQLDGKNLKLEEKEQVKITIISPFLGFRYTKSDFIQDSGYSNIRLYLDKQEYFGEWEIYFSNDTPDSIVYVNYDIFRMM